MIRLSLLFYASSLKLEDADSKANGNIQEPFLKMMTESAQRDGYPALGGIE